MLKFLSFLFVLCLMPQSFSGTPTSATDKSISLYHQNWHEVFFDPGFRDWHERWFLDGNKAHVYNDEEKMILETGNKAYAVLWTKESFKGSLKIEYDFLCADSYKQGVNILYIEATGQDKKGYSKDILKWADKRKNAYMSDYYAHMHTYHLSYATGENDYIRGRRYLPDQWLPDAMKLWGTAIKGELAHAGIFDDKSWIHVTVIKRQKSLLVEFRHPQKTINLELINDDKPEISEGRVGLRLMPKRLSYFKNISISELD